MEIQEMDDLHIRPARPLDAPKVTRLARAYALTGLSAEEANRNGFLVSAYTETTYGDFAREAQYFLVAVDQKGLAGFILAGSVNLFGWPNDLLRQFPEAAEQWVLVKQACIREDKLGTGLAGMLYHAVFDRNPGAPAAAAILLEPPNPRSVRFHEKLGFRRVVEFEEGGLKKGLWKRLS
jgi:predicted GNAT superfamily acetyltransferase